MVRFAVFTDLHYDHVFDGDRRIEEFLSRIRTEQVDFVVSLGDLCYPEEKNRHVRDTLESTGIPVCYVIGNHDSDHCPQETVSRFLNLEKLHYSFVKEQTKYMILNSCYMKKGETCFPYFKKNYEKKSDLYPVIPEFEVEWLKKEMADPKLSYVLFSHHSLANDFAKRGIANRKEIREILETRNTILCMNGHDHGDGCKVIEGIPYFTVNSMTYIWHGLKERFVYDREIHEKYPYLKDMILYRDPLYCIVEIDDGQVHIKGMESDYLHICPEDVGMENRQWNGVSVEPKVSDW